MNKKLKEKIMEALSSVVPITVIVLVLSVSITPMPIETIMMFLVGAVMLIIGMGFFSLGADISMMPMGEGIGSFLTKTKKLPLIIAVCFIMGFIITIAEPDLQVLAGQVASIPSMVLILTIAIGVGIFLVIAMLRIFYKIKLSYMLIFFYAIIMILTIFTPANFIPVSFDSGGVTTGPITVPFILAIGLGLASIRGDKDSHDDSFGLVALCSVGPIMAVQLLGMIYKPEDTSYSPVTIPVLLNTRDIAEQFFTEIPHYIQEVGIAIAPIAFFFIIFQLISKKFLKRELARIIVGFGYTFIGLVLFLTGVNVGFIPAGHFIGKIVADSSFKWLLVPLGMLFGYFMVAAEPAVHVLNKQVEEVSNGAIPQVAMSRSLSIGVAVSLGLTMIRVLTGISILWLIIPGYIIAIILSFFVPKIFTGIAFDSGGVASGPMATTFLLPFAMGACESLGGNILTDAFGAVAMVAMTPLITIQLLGLFYQSKIKAASEMEEPMDLELEDEIIDYEEALPNE